MKYRWFAGYMAVAALGLTMAYGLSVSFLTPAHSQAGAPSDGSLPPEFMNEVNSGTATTPPPQPSAPDKPSGPPPSTAAPSNPPPQEMTPPPAAATSVGPEEYVYDPAGRRDPFRPYRSIRTDENMAKNLNRSAEPLLEPLQKYDIDQLVVMGILWDVRQPRALIRDADGNIHTLVRNAKLGRHNGYVAAIREGEIVVIETVEEDGRTIKRTKVLEFKR